MNNEERLAKTWWRKVLGISEPLSDEERQRLEANWERMMRENKGVMQQRWRAFTDDELDRILEGLNLILDARVDMRSDDMAQEIVAGLARRRHVDPPAKLPR